MVIALYLEKPVDKRLSNAESSYIEIQTLFFRWWVRKREGNVGFSEKHLKL
jgi:hypothetical protein